MGGGLKRRKDHFCQVSFSSMPTSVRIRLRIQAQPETQCEKKCGGHYYSVHDLQESMGMGVNPGTWICGGCLGMLNISGQLKWDRRPELLYWALDKIEGGEKGWPEEYVLI